MHIYTISYLLLSFEELNLLDLRSLVPMNYIEPEPAVRSLLVVSDRMELIIKWLKDIVCRGRPAGDISHMLQQVKELAAVLDDLANPHQPLGDLQVPSPLVSNEHVELNRLSLTLNYN
ncbi:hypothetical protein Drorol1_Dr00004548 [Drosera rotundifolia]